MRPRDGPQSFIAGTAPSKSLTFCSSRVWMYMRRAASVGVGELLDVKRRHRNLAILIIAAAIVAAAGAVVWTTVGMKRDAAKLLERGPSVPEPTAKDAVAMPLTDDGVQLTVKQHSSAWLPGGKLKLHLDDITGRQVIVSVTDADEKVVLSPKSVKKGETFIVSNMKIEVVRLENLLVGSADFGEFHVLPVSNPRN